MDSAEFTIEKNGLGVPLNRYRSGQVLFKVRPAKFCMQRTFSYNEPYAGGGKYPSSSAKVLAASRFVSCE